MAELQEGPSSPLLSVVNALEHAAAVLDDKTKPIRVERDSSVKDKMEESSDVVSRLSTVVEKIERINRELEV